MGPRSHTGGVWVPLKSNGNYSWTIKVSETCLLFTIFMQRLSLIIHPIVHAFNLVLTFGSLATTKTTKERPMPLHNSAHISGPFIDAGHVTAVPANKFLEEIRDPVMTRLKIPAHLLWVCNKRHHEKEVDQWTLYLCTALARHFSYFKAYGMHYHTSIVTATNTITLYDLYKAFREAFGWAYTFLQDTTRVDISIGVNEQERLIELERSLTHETFKRFPDLFAKTMVPNYWKN